MRIAIPISTGLIAIVAVVLAAVALASDGSNSSDMEPQVVELESQQEELQGQLQEIQDSLQQLLDSVTAAQLVAVLDALDGTGIHQFDESTIQAGSLDDVPGGYLADVRKIRQVVGAVSWPEDVQDEAQSTLERADQMEEALMGDDLAAIKAASPQFHAAWHTLREVGYAALTGGEGDEHIPGEHMDGMDGQ